MPLKIRERDIEEKVVRYAKSRGCLCYKFSSPSHRGVCDRIIITPHGFVMFMELKAPGQKPTALQQKFLDEVEEHNCRSCWADSVEDAIAHINIAILLS